MPVKVIDQMHPESPDEIKKRTNQFSVFCDDVAMKNLVSAGDDFGPGA